jgi:hypothetical protein
MQASTKSQWSGPSVTIPSVPIPPQWAQTPIMHYWAFGYRLCDLEGIFCSLPDTIFSPLRQCISALQAMDGQRLSALAVRVAAARREMETCWGMRDRPAQQRLRPLSVSMNRLQAQLMGASREDLLVLLARYQLPLPLPEADWLACLMHELGHATQARIELYLRGLVGCGAEVSGWDKSRG